MEIGRATKRASQGAPQPPAKFRLGHPKKCKCKPRIYRAVSYMRHRTNYGVGGCSCLGILLRKKAGQILHENTVQEPIQDLTQKQNIVWQRRSPSGILAHDIERE